MKTALVISDTHGAKAKTAIAVHRYGNVDMIFHLGDYSRDVDYLCTLTKAPVYSVRGNCDLGSSAEPEIMLSIEGVKVLALHGHKQNVKSSLLTLGLYAQEKEADIALFGHTHMPAEQLYQGVTLYNPGSLGEPRGGRATVGLLTIEDGTFRLSTVKL